MLLQLTNNCMFYINTGKLVAKKTNEIRDKS
jgi:hypothetical protein